MTSHDSSARRALGTVQQLTVDTLIEVPVDDGMIRAAAFIIGDRPRQAPSGGLERGAIGSGFFVTVQSEDEPARRCGYLLTAAHVIERQHKIEVEPLGRAPDFAPCDRITVADWRRPLGDNIDLAVAPFPEPRDQDFDAFDLDVEVLADPPDARVRLGSDVLYIGLLAPLNIPMVRRGTIGHLYARPRLEHGDYPAHLIDCRSYGGFSGSPCFVEISLPGLIPMDFPHLKIPAQIDGPYGQMYSLSRLCGMFTAHLVETDGEEDGSVNRYGVGAMMPVERIREALLSEELREERRERTD